MFAAGASHWPDPDSRPPLLHLATRPETRPCPLTLATASGVSQLADPDPGPPLLREWQDLLVPMQQMGLTGSKEDDRLCGMAVKALRVGHWCQGGGEGGGGKIEGAVLQATFWALAVIQDGAGWGGCKGRSACLPSSTLFPVPPSSPAAVFRSACLPSSTLFPRSCLQRHSLKQRGSPCEDPWAPQRGKHWAQP